MTTQRPSHHVLNRRQVLVGGVAAAALAPIPFALAHQTPDASPSASPEASPLPPTVAPPTPTPLPVPEHKLNIVRQPATYGEPQAGGEIALYIQQAGLKDGNPALQTQDQTLLTSVFEGLVRINPTTMAAEPGIAKSWEWSEDGLTLTFHLRDDVRWHDGSTLTAADAALTTLIYRDDYDSALTGFFGLVNDAVAVDDATLQITFVEPDGAFVFNAACQPLLQAATYQPLWDEYAAGEKTISRPDLTPADWIGTGPWRVAKVGDDRVELERFEDYWDEPAYAEKLTLIAEDDPAARVAGWKSGSVQVLSIRAHQLPDLWGEEGNLFVGPGATTMFVAINFFNPANATETMMVDMNLRQALSLAANRDKYADQLFYGFIDEHAVGIMTQPWLRDTSLVSSGRDVDAARQLLADGGWADIDGDGLLEDGYGNKTDLWAIVREDERPELLGILASLQEDWAEIGVRLTVQQLSPQVFDDRWVKSRDYDLIAYTLVNYPAFNEFDLIGSSWDIRTNVRGWNPGGYWNAGVDTSIQDWFNATDTDAMITAAQAIQHGINDDLFGIWLGFPNDLTLVRKDLQGFNSNMYLYNIGSEGWWRGDGDPIVPTPAATPNATPIEASPEATPLD